MLGTVVAYNPQSGKGLVEGPEQEMFYFDYQVLADDCVPYKGMAVYFELKNTPVGEDKVTHVSKTLPLFDWKSMACIALVFLSLACSLPKGEKGDSGPAGDVGKQGQDGSNGENGLDGAQGPAGVDGQDIANVHAVPFCPGQGTTVYSPSHFPEYGICIANKLYGVMDDSFHTWLAEIVPGNYNSTSTGLVCSFTILANCLVQ